MTWTNLRSVSGMKTTGAMNSNLLIPLNFTQNFMDAFERYLDEHITKIGDFNCIMIESTPDDVMYLCDGSKVVKVINIGTGA